jgi:hypothetical protein
MTNSKVMSILLSILHAVSGAKRRFSYAGDTKTERLSVRGYSVQTYLPNRPPQIPIIYSYEQGGGSILSCQQPKGLYFSAAHTFGAAQSLAQCARWKTIPC